MIIIITFYLSHIGNLSRYLFYLKCSNIVVSVNVLIIRDKYMLCACGKFCHVQLQKISS